MIPLAVLFLLTANSVNAQSLLSIGLNGEAETKVEVKSNNNSSQVRSKERAKVEIKEGQNGQKEKTIIKGDGFKIDGKITVVNQTENSFTVAGRTIFIDLSKVERFSQKGVIEVEAKVKVEGVVIDGKSYAEYINVVGTGQGRSQLNFDQVKSEVNVKVGGAMNQILNFFKSLVVVLTAKVA